VAERERDLLTDIDRSASIRDHLANERTLLAWQRTALALIGLGFVVDRFAFEGRGDAGTGDLLGLAMIIGGGITSIVGAWRFVQTEHQIDTQSYRSALLAHLVLAGAITVGAIVTSIYLLLAR
jgi:putative membrane protein